MVSLKTILFPSISDRQSTLVIIIMIAFLIPDTMINTVSDFLVPQTTSVWGISFFHCDINYICYISVFTTSVCMVENKRHKIKIVSL